MRYKSTRGKGAVDSAEAIIKGIAEDGGLFVPEKIPSVTLDFIKDLAPLSYEERAAKILELFLTDYEKDEIAACVTRAYGQDKFDHVKRAPLAFLEHESVLELSHGPTSAFKDMALELLPQLMSVALKKTGEKSEVLILVATSGDTGKAALEGFAGAEQIKIMVFYPKDGVSRIQELQMVTQEGNNVNVTAVLGNFDDAQNGVKQIFGDTEFNKELAQKGVRLSSANSINWGRLVPQIVYYFSAYSDLLDAKKIKPGDKINFTVPTGNFGNILAGYYAKIMGLPIGRLICASNSNNVLSDFLATGAYDRNRPFHKTISPSMDILISSNLERLLYHVTEDSSQVATYMEELTKSGRYTVDKKTLGKIRETFWGDFVNEEDTKKTIGQVFEKEGYTLDPHSAVAYHAAEKYRAATGDNAPMVVVSTASPYKFSHSVLEALKVPLEGLDEFSCLDILREKSGLPIPQGLAKLRSAKIIHRDLSGKDAMKAAVRVWA